MGVWVPGFYFNLSPSSTAATSSRSPPQFPGQRLCCPNLTAKRCARDPQRHVGKQSADHRVPAVAACGQSVDGGRIAADAEGDMRRDACAQRGHASGGLDRVAGEAGNLDRGDVGQGGDTLVQFIGEVEAGGAGVVVDADRGAYRGADRFEKRVDLVLLQQLVGHRREQQPARTGIFGIQCQLQHIAGA